MNEYELRKKYLFARNFQNHTLIELFLHLEDQQIDVHLIVPRNYPDTQCTLQIQHTNISPEKKRFLLSLYINMYYMHTYSNINVASLIQAAFEDDNWHQMNHKTLVQQLDWLTAYFNTFSL